VIDRTAEHITEADLAIVDFAVNHELRPDGWCNCQDYFGTPEDHLRHLGAVVRARYARVTARAVRHADRRRHA
jgi:hypothetical protein